MGNDFPPTQHLPHHRLQIYQGKKCLKIYFEAGTFQHKVTHRDAYKEPLQLHWSFFDTPPPGGRYTPLGRYTPQGRYTPPPDRYPLAGTPPNSGCWDTVNKRAVHTLLEGILVFKLKQHENIILLISY